MNDKTPATKNSDISDDLGLKFLLDELGRLEDAENQFYERRTNILNQLFSGATVGAILLTAFIQNAFHGNKEISPLPADFMAVALVLTFVFIGSFICWERLADGAASLEVTRAKRALIRRALSKRGYRLTGYISDDINTADAGHTIQDQTRGFTKRTLMALRGFIIIMWAGLAMAMHSLAELLFLSFSESTCNAKLYHVIAVIIHLGVTLMILFRLSKHQKLTQSICAKILGGLKDDPLRKETASKARPKSRGES
ncbi:MAG: hypothetical protein CJBNEKGG_03437 [Prosthecobacter sp.]|nr:hypothetical protein [Prosthecobacter sp.]